MIPTIFQSQKAYKSILKHSSVSDRKRKLKALERAILKYRKELQGGLYADFQKSATETDITEILTTLAEIRFLKKNLGYWMKDKEVFTPLTLFGSNAKVVHEPKGNALIIVPWNYPVNLALIPLAGAIAAGNTVIIKPSEFTPNVSAVMKKMLAEVFEENEVCVIEGAVKTAQELLSLPFDHIFFTGSPAVGKIVMEAAAKNLSSVTLELGGKSPTIVDETANIETAAIRIVWSKFINNGQTCIAPDYILVHKSKKVALINALKKQIEAQFGTDNSSESLCSVINERHLSRLSEILNEAINMGGQIECGGDFFSESNSFSPTIISNVNIESRLMQEEIFGPIIPVLIYEKLDEAIEFINNREKPLALYIFSKSKSNTDKMLRGTSSGGVVINHGLLNFSNSNLPFGGVNHSGIGKAHGKQSFIEFSNEKAVVSQWSPISVSTFLRQPFTHGTKRLIDLLMKWV